MENSEDDEFAFDEFDDAEIEDAEAGAELITVCDKCLQASCWQAAFMCDQAVSAGTVQKTRAELRALALEHPSYWKTDLELCDGN